MNDSERWVSRMLVAPAVLLLFLVTIAPLLFSLFVSLTNLQFGTPQPWHWVGLNNYRRLIFQDNRFLSAFVRTTQFVALGLLFQVVLGYILASLLNRIRRGRTLLLSAILIPSLISQVVAGWQGRMIFNASYGPLNQILSWIGIKGPSWLASQQTALPSVLITDTWQWTPFMALVILAAMQGMSTDILEAARLDGARGWNMFRSIVVPLVLPITGIGILLRGVDLFKTFDLVYILTQGGPGNSSETLTYLTYIHGFKFFNPSYAAAISFIQLIVVTLVAQASLKLMRR